MEGGELIELTEGETRELCVVLLEPEECTLFIIGTISLSPETPTGNEGRSERVREGREQVLHNVFIEQ